MINRARVVARLVIALFCVAGISAPAWAAPDAADCKVFEIKASKDKKKGIDKALKPIAKKLAKPPFDTWSSFELMAQHKEKLERMKALELKLVPGGKLTLLYRDLSRAAGKKARLRLSFTLDDKSGKRVADITMKLDSGNYNLLTAGRLEGDGGFIIATSCAVK